MSDDNLTPTGKSPQIGLLFRWLVFGFAGATIVGQVGIVLTPDHASSKDPGLFLGLWVTSVILAAIAGFVDIFRASRATPWLILGAFLIAVMVTSGSAEGPGGWRIPLFFETGTDVTNQPFAYSPVLETFRAVPYTLFVTLSDLGFWALAVAWVMTLVTWRRKPKPKPDRAAGSSRDGFLGLG